MRKKILLVLAITLLTIVPHFVQAYAIYNGDSSTAKYYSSGGGCQPSWASFCPTGTSRFNHITIRARAVYIDNGVIVKEYANQCYTNHDKVSGCKNVGDIFRGGSNDAYLYNVDAIEKYFGDKDDKTPGDNFLAFFRTISGQSLTKTTAQIQSWMVSECKKLGKGDLRTCHDGTSKKIGGKTIYTNATRGFRIIIEPIYSGVTDGKLDKIRFMTPNEIALFHYGSATDTGWSNASRGMIWTIRLFLKKDDVGFKAPSLASINEIQTKCTSNNKCFDLYRNTYRKKFVDLKNGYGLNLIAWPVTSDKKDEIKCAYKSLGGDKGDKVICKKNGVEANIKCSHAECPNKCVLDKNGKQVCRIRNEPCDCPDDNKENKCVTATTCKDPNRPCDLKPCQPSVCRCVTATKCEDGCGTCDLTPCKSICDYNIQTSIPDVCTSYSRTGLVKDDVSWGCVFKSTKSSDYNVRKHYEEDNSNSYCNVYCKEEIQSNFPMDKIGAYQGRELSLGFGTGQIKINYKGIKTCRVTSDIEGKINETQFLNDMEEANKKIISTWDEYQNAIALKNAYDNATHGPWYTSGECETWTYKKNPASVKSCKDVGDLISNICKSNCKTGKDGNSCRASCSINGKNYNENCKKNLTEDTKDKCILYYDARNWSSSTGYNGVYSKTQSGWVQLEYSSKDSSYMADSQQSTVESKKQSYNTAIANRDSLLAKISSCSNSKPNISYDKFKPTIELEYDEPIYGTKVTLNGNMTESIKNIEYHIGGSSIDGGGNIVGSPQTKNAKTYTCSSGQKCTNTTKTYSYSTWWESVEDRTYYYTLPANVYRYIEKGTGQSTNYIVNSDSQYIDTGRSNLPIHYSTLPGYYNFNITTTSYGDNNKFDNYIIGNVKFDGNDYSHNLIYDCQYSVYCEKTIQNKDCDVYAGVCPSYSNAYAACTGDGLNIIYRTISLISKKEAFPGKNGTGRIPGSNWNNDIVIDKNIVNSRGKRAYEIYKLDPLYEINLTPAIMKQFRKYNKEMNRKVVSIYKGTSAFSWGIAGYSDYSSMKCYSDGSNCKSNLIRGKINGYESIKVKGCSISTAGYYNCGTKY